MKYVILYKIYFNVCFFLYISHVPLHMDLFQCMFLYISHAVTYTFISMSFFIYISHAFTYRFIYFNVSFDTFPCLYIRIYFIVCSYTFPMPFLINAFTSVIYLNAPSTGNKISLVPPWITARGSQFAAIINLNSLAPGRCVCNFNV